MMRLTPMKEYHLLRAVVLGKTSKKFSWSGKIADKQTMIFAENKMLVVLKVVTAQGIAPASKKNKVALLVLELLLLTVQRGELPWRSSTHNPLRRFSLSLYADPWQEQEVRK
ncbi:unnamed protein product [Amoebophrya sp. A120]|nr:unnamed protein product [Amoebophrya sp. A120]|eukprot:GSA120T00016414001.1